MSTTAVFKYNSAWLGKEFGESFARRLFGDEIVDALPRVTRGKNKGKFSASIEWVKCESGGWVRDSRLRFGYRCPGVDEGGWPEYLSIGGGGVERRVKTIVAARLIKWAWDSDEYELYAWYNPTVGVIKIEGEADYPRSFLTTLERALEECADAARELSKKEAS